MDVVSRSRHDARHAVTATLGRAEVNVSRPTRADSLVASSCEAPDVTDNAIYFDLIEGLIIDRRLCTCIQHNAIINL